MEEVEGLRDTIGKNGQMGGAVRKLVSLLVESLTDSLAGVRASWITPPTYRKTKLKNFTGSKMGTT